MQDPKNRQNSPSGHHRTTLSGYIFATKACIDNRKKILLSSNTSPTCPHDMVNFGPLTAEICWRVWGTQLISTGFASWQRYCTALWQWASAKLCGVEQRAPPMFGRATITLGIGPHSSRDFFLHFDAKYTFHCAMLCTVPMHGRNGDYEPIHFPFG